MIATGLALVAWMAFCVPAIAQDDLHTLESLRLQLDEQARRISALEQPSNGPTGPPLPTAPAYWEETLPIERRMESTPGTTEFLGETEPRFLDTPSHPSSPRITGRLHLDYWSFPDSSPGINQIETENPDLPPEDRFELRRLRIGVRGTVAPRNVSYQMDIEYSNTENLEVRDAWIAWNDLPVFNTLRAGNQKRLYGLDDLNSSNFMVFMERPLIVDAVNDPNRRLGLASYGVSKDQVYNWRFGSFNMVPLEQSGEIPGNDFQFEYDARLASTPWYTSAGDKYLHLGLSTVFAFPSANPDSTMAQFRTRPEARSTNHWLDTGPIGGSQSYQLLGNECVLNLGPVQIGGEYIFVWLQRNQQSGTDLFFQGSYLYASYFLTGEHLPWNREMGVLGRVKPRSDFGTTHDQGGHGWGAWQLAARLSQADLNDSDIFGGKGQSATFAINWYWNSHSRLQFNYLVGQIDNRLALNSNGGSNIVSGNYQILGTRLMIDF